MRSCTYSDEPMVERWSPQPSPDDTDVLLRIHHVIGDAHVWLSSVWAKLPQTGRTSDGMPAITPNVFTGSCARMRCCLSEKPPYRHRNGHILGQSGRERKQSTMVPDGFEFRCDNGEKLSHVRVLDCCDREAPHWAVTTGGLTVKQYRT